MLVGEENAGWRLITTQLNHERVMLGPAGRSPGSMTGARMGVQAGWRRRHPDRPRRRAPCTRRDHSIWRINELLNWQVAAAGETIDVADAAATKVFSTERIQGGPTGRGDRRQVRQPGGERYRRTAVLAGSADQAHLVITFGGGVNEVMREMIAASGLKVRGFRGERFPGGHRSGQGGAACRVGRDPVNQPMINNWVEAIGDRNPIYVDEAAAAGHPGVVAPPAMIQVWTMLGLGGVRADDDP